MVENLLAVMPSLLEASFPIATLTNYHKASSLKWSKGKFVFLSFAASGESPHSLSLDLPASLKPAVAG